MKGGEMGVEKVGSGRMVGSSIDGKVWKSTAVGTSDGTNAEFEVGVGKHQGSVLSSLLLTTVMEVLSQNVKKRTPRKLFDADDLVLIAAINITTTSDYYNREHF